MPNSSNALQKLTLAALAIPVGQVNADQALNPDIEARYFNYVESDNRITVDGSYLTFASPLGKRFSYQINAAHEVISGASPMFNGLDSNGDVVQILSGASIEEDRSELDLAGTWYRDKNEFSVSVGASDEDDYYAKYINFSYGWYFNNKQTTFKLGVGTSDDRIEPTFQNRREDKKQHSLSFSLTQVLSKSQLLQSNLSITQQTGFLSDPYKLVSSRIFEFNSDSRPDKRTQWVWLLRYVSYIKRFDSSLHLDYRFSANDWDVQSHTVEATWIKPFAKQWQFAPFIRFYTQSDAEFYETIFDELPETGIFSSDYRLAAYGSLSAGFRLSKKITRKFHIDLSYEYYAHKADYRLFGAGSFDGADFDYQLTTLGIRYSFD